MIGTYYTKIFKKFLFILFVFGCIGSSLLCTGFLYLQWAGATLCCGAWASHRGGFSCWGVWALGVRASVVAVVSHPPSSYGIWFYCDCTPSTISLWLLLCLWMWGIFFGEFQCLPVNGCSAVSCDSSALARGSERTSFYSAILNQSQFPLFFFFNKFIFLFVFLPQRFFFLMAKRHPYISLWCHF